MPLKTKPRQTHHVSHKKEKRTKHFMKVYAPYIPLLLIIGCGFFIYGHPEISGPSGSVESYATETSDENLLAATNKQRQGNGLKPLKFNASLDTAAQAKAQDMASRNYWAHVTPDGEQPWVFIASANYTYRKAAENLAYGFETSNATVNGWMNSPGHRANILDADLEEVGFGIINVPNYQDRGPETIVVAMYGQPAVQSAGISQPVTPSVATAQPQDISYVQSVTAGKAPWSSFVIGLAIGSIIMYLTVKHARGVRRAWRTSENFVIQHPLFDITLVAFVALAAIASQTIGNVY
ncbi:MAG: CAP domain-containing protein [Candidatus Saccharimonadales bacterium]